MRLPTNVYDQTGSAFYKMQAAKAQEKGVALYVGEGKGKSPHQFETTSVLLLSILCLPGTECQ